MKPKEVKRLLEKNKDGILLPTIDNYLKILQNDDAFSEVRYNITTEQPEKGAEIWSDTDDAETEYHIQLNYNLRNTGILKTAFLVFLKQRSFSPIQERIKSIVWDGKPHCEEFFINWAKSPKDEEEELKYSKECGRLFFAQGISRAFNPGSKCDYVVVLMGEQGHGKSFLTELLALDRNYYLKLQSLKGVEAQKNIEGAWIVELEEMLATTNADSVEEVKQFISCPVDKFRNSYGKRSVNHLRTCIFIGTTNHYSFLTDPTGNRRWYPLLYEQDGNYLYEHQNECREEICQCWAEMYHYWQEQSDFASTAPKQELSAIITKHQRDAEADDPELGMIEYWIVKNQKKKICISEIWIQALGNKTWDAKRNKGVSDRIASKLIKLGCTRGNAVYFKGYGKQKAYYPPDSLLNGKEAYQQAMDDSAGKMPF